MRIIKSGWKNPLMRGKCESCGCEIECNKSEVTICNDDPDYPFSIKCPQCKIIVGVNFVYEKEFQVQIR